LTTDQNNSPAIIAELFDQLPSPKFAKPQLGADVKPNIDLNDALGQALAKPEFYPPIDESVFPGDTIAILLQSDLPHPRSVLGALLGQLNQANISASDIVVVISPIMAAKFGIESSQYESPEENAPEGIRPPIIPIEFEFTTINFQVHDAENNAGLAYLVANEDGDPVHVNRLLVDADVILPVGSPFPGETNQQNDCLYPDFASLPVKERFASEQGSFLTRWQEIELANDSLGSFFSIQIICGPGDTIQRIVSGARKDAVMTARATANKLWAFDWNQSSDVVVATIESTSNPQNWDDFAAALIAASRVAKSDGPIVVWTQIAIPPDRNIRKALMSQFEDNISTKLSKSLQHVAAIINERPVFLKSNLKRNIVEELGMGFVESGEQVVRIADSHESGLLIRDAHKCQVRVGDAIEAESNLQGESSQ
jgi:hypothetical protein